MIKGIIALLSLWSITGAVTTSGTISSDETWSDTVLITGDVIVDSGILTIEPGTVVLFASGSNDNVVYGGTSKISLVVLGHARLNAIGTEQDPILFTASERNPDYVDYWQNVALINNSRNSRFKYCIFEFAQNGVSMENPVGVNGPSSPIIEYCIIRYMGSSGIYGNGGASPRIRNCMIRDVYSGMKFHGCDSITVTGCYLIDAYCGILVNGDQYPDTAAAYTMSVTIDHSTIHYIYDHDTRPIWWPGHGVYCVNDSGSITITNSILSDCLLYGLNIQGWGVYESYNCFSTGYYGIGTIANGQVDSTSFDDNPLFYGSRLDSAFDLRLEIGSPCIGTASDGSNIGAWQEGDTWPWGDAVGITYAPVHHASVPIKSGSMFNLRGSKVDAKGNQHGIYLQVGPDGVLRKRMVLE